MKQFIFILILLFYIPVKNSFNINVGSLNPSFQAAKLFCFQDLYSNPRTVYFQNKYTKSTYATQNGTTIIQKTKFPLLTYKKISCNQNHKVLLYTENSIIFIYDSVNDQIKNFTGVLIEDVAYVKSSQNQQKVIYFSSITMHIKNILNDQIQQIYGLNETFQAIECSNYRNKSLDGYCFLIPTNKTKIFYFHISSPEKILQRNTDSFTTFRISQMNQKIYFGFQSGLIKEYSLKQGIIFYQRSANISLGYGIISLVINQIRNQIIYLNSQYKIGIINLLSGYQIGSIMDSINNYNNLSQILLLQQNYFAIHNPLQNYLIQSHIFSNQLIINQTQILPSQILSQICPANTLYYNSTLLNCIICQIGCSLCDQETSFCFDCIDGYFIKDSKCLNCKYASITEQSYNLCFQQKEISVLSISKSITPLFTSGIKSTYSILSGSALIFLFIRFINFWSLVSIYYFLNIDAIPYFLLQFLSKIFMMLYGSVFEYFGIDISSINMQINQKNLNEKMKVAQISTDFLASNFESIVTYLYSLILICVVYDAIKNWLKKFKLHVFQKVKLEACLQEFIGIFIPLMLPLSYFLTNLNADNTLNRLNNALFIAMLGIGSIFPFIYIILIVKRITLKQRLDMIKQQIKSNQKKFQKENINTKKQTTQTKDSKKQTTQTQQTYKFTLNSIHLMRIKQNQQKINNKLHKILNSIDFVNQQEGQKFLYCLISFWSPFLAGLSNYYYFLIFGFLMHSLGLWNAFYAKNWKANLVVQKFILLSYHTCFIIIVFIPSIYFNISIIAAILIICGGIHELITAISEKVYFLYLVFKHKKIIRDNKIAEQISKSNQNIVSIFDIHEKNLNFEPHHNDEAKQHFKRSSFKEINLNLHENFGTKKQFQNIKFIQSNHPILKHKTHQNIKNILFWKENNSIQQQQVQSLDNQNQMIQIKKVKFNEGFKKQNQKASKQQNLNKISKRKIEIIHQEINAVNQKKSQFDAQFIEIQKSLSPKNKPRVKNKLNLTFSDMTLQKNYSEDFSLSQENLKNKTNKQLKFLKVIKQKIIHQPRYNSKISAKTLKSEIQINFSKTK